MVENTTQFFDSDTSASNGLAAFASFASSATFQSDDTLTPICLHTQYDQRAPLQDVPIKSVHRARTVELARFPTGRRTMERRLI